MAITSIKTGSSFTNLVKYDTFLGPNSAYIPTSYESIASATGTGSSSTITFSSIPSTYKHLQIRGTIKYDAAGYSGAGIQLRLNNDSSANYAGHYIYGDGTSVSAGGSTADSQIFGGYFGVQATATNIVGTIIIDIHDYASSTKNKTVRIFGGGDVNYTGSNPGYLGLNSGLWINTSTINRVDILSGGSGNFTTASTFALYGIKG